MNPAFLAYQLSLGKKPEGKKHPLGQKKVRQVSQKFTYDFKPPAEPECRHKPLGGRLSAISLDEGKGQPHSVVSTSGSAPFETECLRLKATPQFDSEDDDEKWGDDELDEEDDNDE